MVSRSAQCVFMVLLALVPALSAVPADRPVAALPQADRLVVHKAQRVLELLHRGEVLRRYKVALGLVPEGPKVREGDFRTPEGRYSIGYRNPRSDYFLSIQVTYPRDEDVKRAKANGWDAGGAIMIHGRPNNPSHDAAWYDRNDWTDGCISVSNSDMVEIWLMTRADIPIDIYP